VCGFFISNNPEVNQSDLDVIESTLRFRGPDCSSGLIELNGWKAYHSRLSIIDLDTGVNQPVLDDNGGLLVLNGEILNYKELGQKYFNRNYTSDSILLSDILASGQLVLDEIDGFFAFVYVASDGQLKNAAKDRFGVKPLYVHKDGGYLSFSSEPNTLRKIFNSAVNPSAIEEYKATRAPIFSGSFFENINTIEPGCCLVQGEYFNCLDYLSGDYADVSVEELSTALRKGIETRKVSDAPIGLLLSKGIDSNLLKEMGTFDKYYSIGFKGDEDIEYLKSQNIEGLTIIECEENEYADDFEYLLNLRGEPMSVPNEVLLYKVSKQAAQDGIKVLLSGEGADEFFAGYDRIFKWASMAVRFDLKIFLDMYCYMPPKGDSNLYQKFRELFLSQEFVSPFEAVRWFFIRYHMPILFRRLDFALMAAGIEGREPIANMHTFKQAIKMSANTLMGDILGKLPLREVIEQYKGEAFAYEKKVGFPVDLTKVFKNEKQLSSYDLWFQENLKVLK